MINLELTTEDAELFKRFREHQDVFQFLLDNNICNYQDGSIRLHYNHEGRIMKVETWKVKLV